MRCSSLVEITKLVYPRKSSPSTRTSPVLSLLHPLGKKAKERKKDLFVLSPLVLITTPPSGH